VKKQNEVKVYFLITSPNLLPEEITNKLKIIPSKIFRRGEKRTSKSTLLHKENGWKLSIEANNIIHINILLKELIKELQPSKEIIKSLNAEKAFEIVIYIYNQMPSISYDKSIISFLNYIEAELEHDIYCLNECN